MITDLDLALKRLSTDSPHPDLDGVADAVLLRVRAEADSGRAAGALAIAAIASVALGVISAGSLHAPPAAAATLSPFEASTALAPSTLLMTSR